LHCTRSLAGAVRAMRPSPRASGAERSKGTVAGRRREELRFKNNFSRLST
jgi:hypothetical protein